MTTPAVRDSFLFCRKVCIAWTSLGLLSIACSANAFLKLAHSKFTTSGGASFKEVTDNEALVIATPIVLIVQFLFLRISELHLKARRRAGLSRLCENARCASYLRFGLPSLFTFG